MNDVDSDGRCGQCGFQTSGQPTSNHGCPRFQSIAVCLHLLMVVAKHVRGLNRIARTNHETVDMSDVTENRKIPK